jgi:S1-C subfamily serine protease
VRTVNQQGRAIQNQNFAIGVDRVKQVVAFLRTGKSLQWTGLNLSYPTTEELQANNLTTGVKATTSVKGSPADKAGITGGMTLLIIGVNGKRIENSLASYCAGTAGIQSGQEATFTVQDISDPAHPGKPKALKLKFA